LARPAAPGGFPMHVYLAFMGLLAVTMFLWLLLAFYTDDES
jgi:hypothetical protein